MAFSEIVLVWVVSLRKKWAVPAHCSSAETMKLSMIVLITSCAP